MNIIPIKLSVSSHGKSKSCLATFVERKSRFLIVQVMENRKSSTFNQHCFNAFSDIPCKLVKTFTADRDKKSLLDTMK